MSSPASWPSATSKPLTRPTPAPKPTADPGKSWTAVGPHPRQAAGSISVKFCAPAAILSAPREVCASAVKTADHANSTPIASESVTLRIGLLPGFVGKSPLFSSDAISFDLAAARQNGPPAHPKRPGMDNEALCVINFAYGLETVTTVPPTPL